MPYAKHAIERAKVFREECPWLKTKIVLHKGGCLGNFDNPGTGAAVLNDMFVLVFHD